MSIFQDLKYKFNNLDAFGKIIVINVIVFVVDIIFVKVVRFNLFEYFKLPSGFMDFLMQPWSLISYGFLHGDIWHLLFNMLFLFYLSRTASNLFRTKMVLNVYFLGVIFGGLAYLAVSNIIPTDFFGTRNGVIVGASAGVGALLMFIATYMPNSEIRLFNTLNVKWKHIAIFFVVLDVFRLMIGINQGGYIAHIGGYLLGYYYAKRLMKGKDIGAGFEKAMDSVVSLFKTKSNLKTVHRSTSRPTTNRTKKATTDSSDKQKKIDAILDKISKSGYDSLTAKEKAFLFETSKED